MSIIMHIRGSELCRILKGTIVGLGLLVAPTMSVAEIIWSGDFNNRDFSKYHASQDPEHQFFFLVPEYGRPPLYHPGQKHVGNGDLLDLVSSPTRGGRYAARLTVKNSINGREPADCDPALDCNTRRTGLQMTRTMRDFYNGIPYNAERWLSLSV